MPVTSFSPFDTAQLFHAPPTAGTPARRLDTHVGAIALSRELTGQLSVTTAEGDRVTLSAELAESLRVVSYSGHAREEEASVEVDAYRAEHLLSRTLGLTVEGDLNDEEIRDLTRLFRKAVHLFRKFFNGQDDAALAKTARLTDRFEHLSSLASLDLDVEVQRSVTVMAARLAATVGDTATPAAASEPWETPGEAPSATTSLPPSRTGTAAPTQHSETGTDVGIQGGLRLAAPAAEDHRKSLAEQVLDAVHESGVEGRKLRKYLPRLLDRVREELEQWQTRPGSRKSAPSSEAPVPSPSALFIASQSYTQTSLLLSIRS
jgi:pyruvate/2-oxoglutarate dehydrogenase complex dihydrolipoamide acyltransferase (E2) component